MAAPISLKALVVGGEHSFVIGTLSTQLSRHGIAVHEHWSWDLARAPAALPKGIDLVYILTDLVGHNLSIKALDHARAANIPFVNSVRKWAEATNRLTTAKFPLLTPQPTIVAPLNNPFPTDKRRKLYVTALAMEPTISNEGIRILVASHAAQHGYTSGDSADPSLASALRKEFGITAGGGASPKVSVDSRKYMQACLKYGVIPNVAYAPPPPSNAALDRGQARIESEILGSITPTATVVGMAALLADPQPVPPQPPAPSIFDKGTWPKARVETVPTAEVPREVLAATPANVQPPKPTTPVAALPASPSNGTSSWMNDDLKVALQLVRGQFEGLGIESLTITKDGVRFRRVVVEEGDVQI
jgi:hypothetical protein